MYFVPIFFDFEVFWDNILFFKSSSDCNLCWLHIVQNVSRIVFIKTKYHWKQKIFKTIVFKFLTLLFIMSSAYFPHIKLWEKKFPQKWNALGIKWCTKAKNCQMFVTKSRVWLLLLSFQFLQLTLNDCLKNDCEY